MALIPQYVSKESPTSQPGADIRSAGNTGGLVDDSYMTNKEGYESANELKELGNAITKIEIDNASSKATVAGTSLALSLTEKVKKDPDVSHSTDKVDEDWRKQGEELSKMYPTPLAQREFLNKWGEQGVRVKGELEAVKYKRIVEQGDFYGKRDLNLKGEELSLLQDPALRDEKKLEMVAVGQSKVESGIWEKWDAQKYYEDALYNSAKLAIYRDYNSVSAELQKSDGGIYSDIPAEKRLELVTQVKTQERLEKAARKDAEENTRFELNNAVLQNSINEDQIDMLVKQNEADPYKGISKATGEKLKNALYKQIDKDVDNIKAAKKYVKAADMVFTNYPDRIKAYDAIIDAFTGPTTRDELQYLGAILKESKENYAKPNIFQSFGRLLWSGAGLKTRNHEEQMKIIRNYITRVRSGTHPSEAYQATLWDTQVEDHPALAANPEAVSGIYYPGKGVTYLSASKPKPKK